MQNTIQQGPPVGAGLSSIAGCARLLGMPGHSTLGAPAPLIAHQYGWDEVLLFVVPVVAAIVVIRSLERRRRSRQDENASDD